VPADLAFLSLLTMAEWLTRTDGLTFTLGAVAAAVFVASKWIEPVSMVPSLILGRQSDASRTRLPGESATWRNYGTGFMSAIVCAPHNPLYSI
jgi:long-chain acyl-CoA synthetase